MITYSELYEVLRKEKYSEQLQSLPKDFFSNVAEYLDEKKKMTQKESDIFSEAVMKIKKQYETAIAVIKELIMKREKKIINLAMVATKIGISKRDIENMLENERELFESVTKKIEETEKKFNAMMESGENKKDLKNRLIRFIQDTSEITDLEGKRLGPFREGDVANLPQEISEVLIKAGQAVKIETED